MIKRLTRNPNGMLGGVCAGIADYFELDPTLIRMAYILISILSVAFPGIFAYIILWIVIPDRK
ncbi:MAG: PspC domain-containing protein [Flavobacteriales bacterium]